MIRTVSIPKENNYNLNEDAISSFRCGLALSDGAGGGGLFAEEWSKYLVSNIPHNPILSWEELDAWLSEIWEEYYLAQEQVAQSLGCLALEKFYDEGSYATLSAIWIDKTNNLSYWMCYGDSVVFHYRLHHKLLEYTISSINDFNKTPYLINCKTSPERLGFNSGKFKLYDDSIVFICSDALSHYILLMYYLNHKDKYSSILEQAMQFHTRYAFCVKTAYHIGCKDFNKVLSNLISSCKNKANFRRHLSSLERKGLLVQDDYSFGYISL